MEYKTLHDRFEYLQEEKKRLHEAYTLALQELDALNEDNAILSEKLLKIRVRRRKLLLNAEDNMRALMTPKTLFCRRNRRHVRRKFPMASRRQVTMQLEEEWEALPSEDREKWQRELESYAAKPIAMAKAKAPSKARGKTRTTDENKPKAPRKRPTPKKKEGEVKKPRKSPQVKAPRKPTPAKKPSAKGKGKKVDVPAPIAPPVQDEPDSSGGSSAAASDEDDSDDNMMHLPMGAFG
ncbi:hypothetical protein THRCLA_20629 [Thraustotheca clavata]|uniref:HMG box domain-containing protein n=1 Tax=Thraustotheca clavata TaxID=74557 RepID=A0A1W0A543_9STRA|nr:hypothetical protein THRCLA_20629 [Thraustotheca clavata]